MRIHIHTYTHMCTYNHPHSHAYTHPITQAIIGNYAVPILEERSVWGTNDTTKTAYLDTQDAARLTLAALRCV